MCEGIHHVPARHEKLAQGLQLVMLLSGTRMGRTIPELETELGCGRRTVERLLAAVRQVCGDLDVQETDTRERRYRLGTTPLSRTVPVTASEITEIDLAARRLDGDGLPDRAALLRLALQKLCVIAEARTLHRAELDTEVMLENEGLAMRPGPRVRVADGIVAALRVGIIGRRSLRLAYQSRGQEPREHILEPLGLIYGARPYLLAAPPGKPKPAVWRLDRIVSVVDEGTSFEPREGFSLASVVAQSFGVWQEKAMNVELRFAESAALDAAAWQFHPTQHQVLQPDGTLLVSFVAGGLHEMAFHFATWGDAVEVLKPAALRERLATLGAELVRRHAG
jgi:predicted DNA-binding transcriptional regulator YafY